MRSLAIVLGVPLCASIAGCALSRGDFASRGAPAAVATSTPDSGAIDLKPAVLVQDGASAAAPNAQPQQRTASVNDAPPLPQDATKPAPTTKTLSPEEKAKVIAELEALARGEPASSAATSKPDCTVTASVGTAPVKTADATGCANQSKAAQRP